MSGWNRTMIGRRRFVQLVGWAGAAAIAHGGPALAESARKSKATSRPPQATPTPTPGEGGEVSAEARALAEVAKRRYGEHLSASDLEKVAKDLDGDLKGMQRLREVKLTNADEPDVTFHA